MAGDAGSTLLSELNRLANGGSYPSSRNDYVGPAEAANTWAGTSGLDVIGALNTKAGFTSRNDWLGLDGACNAIAGTSGLTAVVALRTLAS